MNWTELIPVGLDDINAVSIYLPTEGCCMTPMYVVVLLSSDRGSQNFIHFLKKQKQRKSDERVDIAVSAIKWECV
jgi:hypothetical protein